MTTRWTPFEIITGTAAGLLCITFACVSLEAGAIETGLARRAVEALQDSGLYWAAVEPHGRRLVLSGGVSGRAAAEQAAARVAALSGVAGVENQIVVLGPAGACQARLDETRGGRAVKFRKGQADLAPASEALLAELAGAVEGCDVRVEVAVHADPGTNAAVAQVLTQRRAERIARRLVEHGVAVDRVVATGYGTTQPIGASAVPSSASEQGADVRGLGRSADQRVEFRVLGAAS